ncbi:MAG: dihydrodipicolinate synthase family protein [Acidobacteria bacterium]|nr:dihydrodipicolinate synthase family protein [Acidobacteriota bacterium]
MSSLFGILPAVVTPLDSQGNLSISSYEALLARVYGQGVHGIYVAGQTGEGLSLTVADRKKLAEASVANSPKGSQVIVHIGAHRTVDAIELAKHASSVGVTAVSSLPPIGVFSFPEIKSYYQALAAASDVPFLIYFFPGLCPAITSHDQILELCTIPNVVGLKFTDMNLYRLERIKKQGHVVYNGHDEVLAAGLLMGADGGIGTFYNLTPELFLEVFRCMQAKDIEGAMKAQARINELIELTLRVPALSAVKRMMTWSGIPCGDPVAPRRTMTAEDEQKLIAMLAASSFKDAPFAKPR